MTQNIFLKVKICKFVFPQSSFVWFGGGGGVTLARHFLSLGAPGGHWNHNQNPLVAMQ